MNEKILVENLLRLLKRGQWTLTGEEALAFHQCFDALTRKLRDIEVSAALEANVANAPVAPITNAAKGKKHV